MFETRKYQWLNEPKNHVLTPTKLIIETEENTDLWQKTYYGFENDNAPALLYTVEEQEFTAVITTEFNTKTRFDQCGILVYQDSQNWFKSSSEYENTLFQRLGSVVTNNGYSDWATQDISAEVKKIYYRLSRRGKDFQIEYSFDGCMYRQLRIFHFFAADATIQFGLYACSPEKSSFQATFTELAFGPCIWADHV